MSSFLQVTAPLAVVRDESGAQHYFYQGAILPAGLDGEHVKLLVESGVVSKVEASDDVDVPDDAAKAKRAPARKSGS